ncbi:MAG TPA: restriction endonuclease subunit S [Thermoanaerobaculia bacterium]|jgi:type I restriction enzyme S subunit|nr:restriction endonuclease subunit S [Thermoanaerobaculia bacterium]
MKLKPGYKQTEAGIVPDDWLISSLQGICREPITYGIVQCGPNIMDGIPYVRVSDMEAPELDVSQMLRTAPAIANRFTRSTVQEGDLVYALRGRLGEVRKVTREVEGANLTQGTARIAPKPAVSTDYLFWAMRSTRLVRQAELQAKGTTFREITLADLRCLHVPLPPTQPEQHAIAAALSDVDALLTKLDRLIAKKRDLKQAAMQQLLTGQTRLPGFSEEWEMKRLGDHVTFLRNGVNSRAELRAEGRVRYLHYGNVHSCTNVFVSPEMLPSLSAEKAASLDRLCNGDLIFADASEDVTGVSKSVEMRNVGETEVVAGLHTIAARFDKTVLADGFKGFLQFCQPFAAHLRRLAAGTKVYATNRAHVASVEMRLPSVEEQTAIATVLSDMDAEIAALERRRAKTRDLKQAMMQELLTGRTRLV